jgi:cell division protein FtsI (penicillin-binding protein 3)
VPSIGAHPKQIEDPAAVARALAKALGLDRKKVLENLQSDSPFVWIARHVSPDEVEKVDSLGFEGLVFKTEPGRFYPHKTMAGQVLGIAGIDGKGLEGVEFYYRGPLKGREAKFRIVRDALGRAFGLESGNDEDLRGNNIVLTIDRAVQYIAEGALKEAVTENRAKSGIAIVMVPKTGAILALAHYPFFNPNKFREYSRFELRNRAISDPFEPGSTMKMFSAAAALESGVAGRYTTFYCENGRYRIGKNVVHDTHPHEILSLEEIVKFSSNIGAAKLSERMGSDTLYEMLTNFGFGRKTGIDCPGETSGLLSAYQRWSKIDSAAISFGQGVSVSAIQLIAAVSAIANNGILMKPYIAQAITDKNGALVRKFGPTPVRRAVSSETARIVAKILSTVTEEKGTGVNAALAGYKVCGKTGTAQKVGENGRYAKKRYMASFVGFVPLEYPAISILVVVDEPKKSIYGGTVAAPAFRKIALQALNYLNIAPGGSKERLTAMRSAEGEG